MADNIIPAMEKDSLQEYHARSLETEGELRQQESPTAKVIGKASYAFVMKQLCCLSLGDEMFS